MSFSQAAMFELFSGRLGCLDTEEERFHDAISTGQFNEPVQLNNGPDTQSPYPLCPPQGSSSISGPSFTGVQGEIGLVMTIFISFISYLNK